ncbi:hypothetical protein E5288_WYG012091 [Bos mutus]|uniref:Uncharacterized protein n=1 Tax=Bos mutus TaxID=72004 RepID=A0A6B0R2J2_9CETA|nr:hypothetical protein [Bos mutus]
MTEEEGVGFNNATKVEVLEDSLAEGDEFNTQACLGFLIFFSSPQKPLSTTSARVVLLGESLENQRPGHYQEGAVGRSWVAEGLEKDASGSKAQSNPKTELKS